MLHLTAELCGRPVSSSMYFYSNRNVLNVLKVLINILTDKRKDIALFTILVYEIQELSLFDTGKSYACCVIFVNLSQDQ